MTSPEQAAAPLDPLAVCEDKFNEAYDFSLRGNNNMYRAGGSEVAPFFDNGSRQAYFFLHRPLHEGSMRTPYLRFWLVELTQNPAIEREKKLDVHRRDFIVMADGKVVEVGLLDDDATMVSEETFTIGIPDLPTLQPNFRDFYMTHELETDVTDELFSDLRYAIPIDI